jgi:O-antigen/teichoic acid export membrane protein
MGVVKRQTLKSVIYTYAGTLIGFLTMGVLFPAYLTPSQIGVLNLVNRWSLMIMQIGTLGFPAAMIKFFPYFKDQEKKHHGFLFTSLLIGFFGFIICSSILFIFNADIIENEKEKSPLFSQYFNYIYLVTFFYIFFYLLDVYSRVIYQSSAAVLLREFVQRVMILVLIIAVIAKWMGMDLFIILYFITLCVPTIFLFLFLWVKKEIHLTPNLHVLRSEHKSGIVQRSLFGLISGLGISGLLSIDSIMLNEFNGEEQTGIYTTVFYFPLLILIPSRAFVRLAGNIVAECIKENDMERLKKVYYDSCLTQYIAGIILLALMIVNTDNIFLFLKPEFRVGYWVILIIGIGNLFEMATGVNHSIIDNSKYFRFGTYFVALLIVCAILLNLIFIPWMGITGVAIATALSMIIYNLVKTVFIYSKYKLIPFNLKFLWILLISALLVVGVLYIPDFSNVYMNTLLKSTLVFVPLFGIIYLSKFSMEFNGHVNNLLNLIKARKNG